jgi:hypothetical protein
MHFLRSPSLLSSLSCVRRTGAESGCSCPSPAAAATRRSVPFARAMCLPSSLTLLPTRRRRSPHPPLPLFDRQLLPRLRQPFFLPAAPAEQPDTHETHTEPRTTSMSESLAPVWSRWEGCRPVPLPSSSCSVCRCPLLPLSLSQHRRSSSSMGAHYTTHTCDQPLHACVPPLSAVLTCHGCAGVVPALAVGGCSACSRSQPLSLGGRLLPLHRPGRGKEGAG